MIYNLFDIYKYRYLKLKKKLRKNIYNKSENKIFDFGHWLKYIIKIIYLQKLSQKQLFLAFFVDAI